MICGVNSLVRFAIEGSVAAADDDACVLFRESLGADSQMRLLVELVIPGGG